MLINLFGTLVYSILYLLFWRLYFQVLGHGKVKGTLPSQPFILIANHGSYLDWLLLDALFHKKFGRKIRFVAKSKLMTNPLWRFLIRYRGAIVVDGNASRKSGEAITDSLRLGEIIAIFPEGTRSPSKKLMNFQKGFAYLALKTKNPIVPVGLVGFYDNWPRQCSLPRWRPAPMEIRIGSPIEVLISQVNRNTIDSLVDNSVEHVKKLLD